MKKYGWLTILLALVIVVGSLAAAHAEIRRPYGIGQIGYTSVVLCEELTLRKEPNTGSTAVKKLKYGSWVLVDHLEGGWAYCFLDDSEDAESGWVNADFLAIDPAWYVTEGKTTVYAWSDTNAPKVALLNANITLPVLKEEGDWLVVSLRGASGWIHK